MSAVFAVVDVLSVVASPFPSALTGFPAAAAAAAALCAFLEDVRSPSALPAPPPTTEVPAFDAVAEAVTAVVGCEVEWPVVVD